VGEIKAVSQHFGLSSSGCGRAANDGAQCGGTVVSAAVAWMPGGGRRPGWVSLGQKGHELGPGAMGLKACFGGKQKKMETGRTREWAEINNGLLKSFSDLNQGFEFNDSKIQILSGWNLNWGQSKINLTKLFEDFSNLELFKIGLNIQFQTKT
jgi:hypothetical protein